MSELNRDGVDNLLDVDETQDYTGLSKVLKQHQARSAQEGVGVGGLKIGLRPPVNTGPYLPYLTVDVETVVSRCK